MRTVDSCSPFIRCHLLRGCCVPLTAPYVLEGRSVDQGRPLLSQRGDGVWVVLVALGEEGEGRGLVGFGGGYFIGSVSKKPG